MMFSARPSSYLVATPDNRVWGASLQSRGRPERRLFPGATVVLLAMVGLLLKPPSRNVIVYLLALVLAFEMSLGFSGHIYGWLYQYIPVYRGLRAAARLGIYVLLFLSILAGYGMAAIVEGRRNALRITLSVIVVALMVYEYRVDLALSPYPNSAPSVYRALAQLPPGIVAELPAPHLDRLPEREAEYAYASIFHWHVLVNGYSGAYPNSYLRRMERLRHFPDAEALTQLKADDVRYVILHKSPEWTEILSEMLTNPRFTRVGAFHDAAGGEAHLFLFR
jgi:hypothetical protein